MEENSCLRDRQTSLQALSMFFPRESSKDAEASGESSVMFPVVLEHALFDSIYWSDPFAEILNPTPTLQEIHDILCKNYIHLYTAYKALHIP